MSEANTLAELAEAAERVFRPHRPDSDQSFIDATHDQWRKKRAEAARRRMRKEIHR